MQKLFVDAGVENNGGFGGEQRARICIHALGAFSVVVFAALAGSLGAYFLRPEDKKRSRVANERGDEPQRYDQPDDGRQ